MARVGRPVMEMFERSGLIECIGADQIFVEVDDAVQHLLAAGDAAATGDES